MQTLKRTCYPRSYLETQDFPVTKLFVNFLSFLDVLAEEWNIFQYQHVRKIQSKCISNMSHDENFLQFFFKSSPVQMCATQESSCRDFNMNSFFPPFICVHLCSFVFFLSRFPSAIKMHTSTQEFAQKCTDAEVFVWVVHALRVLLRMRTFIATLSTTGRVTWSSIRMETWGDAAATINTASLFRALTIACGPLYVDGTVLLIPIAESFINHTPLSSNGFCIFPLAFSLLNALWDRGGYHGRLQGICLAAAS